MKKKKIKNWEGTCISGKEVWKRIGSDILKSHLTSREISQDEGEIWCLGGEQISWFGEGKMKRDQHRWSQVPPCSLQPETFVCWVGWGLGSEAQYSEVRSRERTGVGMKRQLERTGVCCVATKHICGRSLDPWGSQSAIAGSLHLSVPPCQLLVTVCILVIWEVATVVPPVTSASWACENSSRSGINISVPCPAHIYVW